MGKVVYDEFLNKYFDENGNEVKGAPQFESYSFEDGGNMVGLIPAQDTSVVDAEKVVAIENAIKNFKNQIKVLEESKGISKLEVVLYTGKTHQIRAHLAHVGHPVVGDGKYGDYALNKQMNLNTQMLTAYQLTLHFDSQSPLYYLNGKIFNLG